MRKKASSYKANSDESTLARLQKAGYPRLEDQALIRPSGYEDESVIVKLGNAPDRGAFLAEVECLRQKVVGKWPTRHLVCLVEDDSREMTIRFMNFNEGMRQATREGKRFRIFGELAFNSSQESLLKSHLEMIHPKIRGVTERLPDHLTPRYPTIQKISNAALARQIKRAVRFVAEQPDPIPPDSRKRTSTLPLHESLRILHSPKKSELGEVDGKAVPSLKFDEWLAHILLQRHRNKMLKRRSAPAIASSVKDIDKFASHLPFDLTESQIKAMTAIAKDISQPQAMRRLLHGDVGSGKTLVAAFGCWLAARQGLRSAFMCPTVILANQHYTRLKTLFEDLGVRCVQVTGVLKPKERRFVQEQIASHADIVVIGTHTLVQAKTDIPDLAFAVIDEQHRFGVAQRKALERKSTGAHVLMMSATPIPRTLELGMLSHLEITRLDNRPGKADIRTLVFSSQRIDEVLYKIINQDLQTYWICPLITKSATSELRAAEAEYQRISQLVPQLQTALIHGKLSNDAKLKAMQDFEDGKTRLLVATTVVEVGIDAPQADVIVIDHAERLGLSQLHQLRGRVGRRDKTGFCALVYDPNLSEEAVKRIQVMHTCSDGFDIAQQDLLQRGPGDIIGKRQSGTPKYKYANLGDPAELLEQARAEAQLLLEKDPQLCQKHVSFWLGGSRLLNSQDAKPWSRRPQ